MNKAFIILGGIILLVGIYVWTTYNKLISANEAIDSQWAQVETQYQRRFDLIPNLVGSVKGVMAQEQKIFGDLADARSRYANASETSQKAEAATQVEGALSRLLVIMENYPELKSSENVQTLMAQLEGTENRISVERKRYNDVVQSFNVTIKRFPANMIAHQLGYSERNYFEAETGTEKAPTVDLLQDK
ncbi:MAG: LemA family protein [Candidatus Moraniibacteriota bacterium]|nr:MAG: LemA family protein [Candidatus Moranbacteria bacterium]